MMLHLKTKNWEKEKENYNARSHVTIDNVFLFFSSLAAGMLFRGGKGED
jgi:hypothetical protein